MALRADQVATAGDDKLVKVWDVATGKLLCTQVGHNAPVVSVAFSSNGQKMASGGADGSVCYWTVPLPPIPPDDLEKITAVLPEKATVAPKQPRKLLRLPAGRRHFAQRGRAGGEQGDRTVGAKNRGVCRRFHAKRSA